MNSYLRDAMQLLDDYANDPEVTASHGMLSDAINEVLTSISAYRQYADSYILATESNIERLTANNAPELEIAVQRELLRVYREAAKQLKPRVEPWGVAHGSNSDHAQVAVYKRNNAILSHEPRKAGPPPWSRTKTGRENAK